MKDFGFVISDFGYERPRPRIAIPGPRPRHSAIPSAFTLVELLVSIAIVLILILGVNQVFHIASQTIGAGQALSLATRDNRSAQSVFYNDLAAAVAFDEAPAFIIHSQITPGFQNRAREQAAQGADFRTDRLAFFARDRFRRQTGDGNDFIGPETSGEAWIWYGHLNQPGVDGFPWAPGFGDPSDNPDNFFAIDWVLGRVVTLLVNDPESDQFFQNDIGILAPLGFDSESLDDERIQRSRYDIADTSISDFRFVVDQSGVDWWDEDELSYRFLANLYPARPITGARMARTVPAFLPHTSEFIVEYAGDFLTQDDNSGSPTYGELDPVDPIQPDGTIDFYVDDDGVRRIQWYGLARDTTGDGDNDVLPLWEFAGWPAFDPTDPDAYPFERDWTPDHYIVAWGPDTTGEPTPRLLRITLTLEDPNNRLERAQRYQYILRLP